MTRFSLSAAVLFTVSAGMAWAGQVSVINPPNIVVTPPPVPTVSPTPLVTPGAGITTAPSVSGPAPSVSAPVPAPISGFPVTSMSAPQMQQAIATIDRLVAGGSLSPEQAQILTQQAQQMRNALNP